MQAPPPLVDPLPPPLQSMPPLSAATSILLNNNLDSVESSPRLRTVVDVDQPWPDQEPLLPHVPGAKLRLMISYGGHIMPRPHDKSLSYVGGDTRMVSVDRHTSLKDLCSRLSRTLLHGRPFTLKYQLPNEELDNLITVTTDEDLDNMVEEHDRLSSKPSSSSPSRLRVFLFFCKPDTALSMGSLTLLDDAKSETWFVDALNNSGIISRVFLDSAAVDECLVNLDDVIPDPSAGSSNHLDGNGGGGADISVAVVGDGNNKQQGNNNTHLGDVHSVPGSPVVVENNSSCYGSSSSSSSMATLPPIKVRVDENGGSRLQLVMEEQFAQMASETGGVVKQDDGYAISSSSVAAAAAATAIPVIPAPVTMVVTTSAGDNVDKVESDEDRSLFGHQGGFRKPPLPLQLVQPRTFSGHFGLPSPDSVASDSSIQSSNSYSNAVYYQEQVQQASHVDNNKAPPLLQSLKSEQIISDPSHALQMDQNQQLQHHHQQQQQFVYIHHHLHPASTTGQVPMSPYYTVYAPPIVSSSHHHHNQQIHHPIGQHQQYSVYVMAAGTTQQYNMTMQSNIVDPNNNNNNNSNNNVNVVVASSRPIIPQSSAASASASAAYKDATPPIYPTKLVTPTTLPSDVDVAPNVYKAVPVAASSPAFVQIPTHNQFQQQYDYVGMTQNSIHLPVPTQPNAIATSATTNYGYEYGGPTQDQVYYTQQQSSAPQPPQYQSMTPAAAAAALSDVSSQFPIDNIQQLTRTTTQPV